MKKHILLFHFFLFILVLSQNTFANENTHYSIGIVNTNSLNLRSGTDINFPILAKIKKDDIVKVFVNLGEWYIVQSSDNQIGVVKSDYITIDNSTDVICNNSSNSGLSVDENKVLELINNKRKEKNLSPLIIDDDVQNLAKLKAIDLVENNCFTHYSPSYGSPFEMLKNNSIKYKVASENIAGNSDIEKAVDSWLNSNAHKNNIFSNDFNYTGIGVVNSLTYGKIIVEIFIGK